MIQAINLLIRLSGLRGHRSTGLEATAQDDGTDANGTIQEDL